MKQRFSKRTRLVSALLTLAMVFTFLPFSAFAAEGFVGPIELVAYNFPDEAFRNYLNNTYNKDGDNVLSPAEREAVYMINIRGGYNGKKITNLEGIKFFPNLWKLNCSENDLTHLDVSYNTNLQELICYENKLISLDVRKNSALQYLSCYDNNLTSLDVSKNPTLQELSCSKNNLTSLDVSGNVVLASLYCYKNKLTSLDVSQNPDLLELGCYDNYLTSLDVSDSKMLKILECGQNGLKELDVSQNPALRKLECYGNNLTSLDVSKNTELTGLYCYGNQLTELDVSQNAELQYLYCNQNRLTSLQADNCTKLKKFECDNNVYNVKVYEKTGILDPGILPGNFDISRVRNLNGAAPNADGTLTVKSGGGQVTYEYRCYGSTYETFTLNVTEVDDPNAGIVPPVTPPSGGDTPGGGSTGGGDGGGAIVIVAAAGAAVAGVVGYGVYNYVSGRKLQALLPEGVAAPENRAQTALLLWNTAGRPEPAEAPAFADVADPDTAKAAQWCVEQGLMKRRLNGKFAPGSSIPAYQVLNAYRKLAGG